MIPVIIAQSLNVNAPMPVVTPPNQRAIELEYSFIFMVSPCQLAWACICCFGDSSPPFPFSLEGVCG